MQPTPPADLSRVPGRSARTHRLDALATGRDGLVQLAVERVEPSGWEAPVFNLEVHGAHTYFANGVLAHNKIAF